MSLSHNYDFVLVSGALLTHTGASNHLETVRTAMTVGQRWTASSPWWRSWVPARSVCSLTRMYRSLNNFLINVKKSAPSAVRDKEHRRATIPQTG